MVTGATTPIGSALIEDLANDPSIASVIAVGREEYPQFRFSCSDRVKYFHVDLAHSRQMKALLFGAVRNAKVQAVIHTAMHRRASASGGKTHAFNVETTRELLRLSEAIPSIKQFIFRSYAEVYKIRADRPSIIAEGDPLELSCQAPQWVRDRVEADLTVCAQMGLSRLRIAVLRVAECLAPNSGSQLYDYLNAPVCFRPLGFDPVLNLISISDVVRGLVAALKTSAQGVFNIPGKETLPLSALIDAHHRRQVPIPGRLLGPLYRARAWFKGSDFRYDMNRWRFHYSGVLDGRRAKKELEYEPKLDVLTCPIERTGNLKRSCRSPN